jgi:hypothetical protein
VAAVLTRAGGLVATGSFDATAAGYRQMLAWARAVGVVARRGGVRSHLEIENRLHWVRDVTYQEDKSLVRTGNAPRVMASLRSLAIGLLRLDGHASIAAANRHHARNPQRTLQLLQTS